jgi:hypothetical protein
MVGKGETFYQVVPPRDGESNDGEDGARGAQAPKTAK